MESITRPSFMASAKLKSSAYPRSSDSHNPMNNIPNRIRKQISKDEDTKMCSLYGQLGHVCDGRITMEHAIYFAGKQLQEKWAIIPLCASGHGVDDFQD